MKIIDNAEVIVQRGANGEPARSFTAADKAANGNANAGATLQVTGQAGGVNLQVGTRLYVTVSTEPIEAKCLHPRCECQT